MANEIELRADNPFSLGEVFVYPEGDSLLFSGDINYVKSKGDRYFTVVEGDTLWTIANEAYGNSKYWWLIQKVNDLGPMPDPGFELPIGKSLLIPDLPTFKTANL